MNTLGLEGNFVRTHWEHQKPEKLQSPGRTLFPKPIKNLLTPSEWGSFISKHPPDSTLSEQAAFLLELPAPQAIPYTESAPGFSVGNYRYDTLELKVLRRFLEI
jgi:hypothetical protein